MIAALSACGPEERADDENDSRESLPAVCGLAAEDFCEMRAAEAPAPTCGLAERDDAQTDSSNMMTVFANGMAFPMPFIAVNAGLYFPLPYIESALAGAWPDIEAASFLRGINVVSRGPVGMEAMFTDGAAGEGEPRIALVSIGAGLSRGPFNISAGLGVVTAGGLNYFCLTDLGHLLGFAVSRAGPDALSISAWDPPGISEHGSRAARAFLRPFLTLHADLLFMGDDEGYFILDTYTDMKIAAGPPFFRRGAGGLPEYVQRADLYDLNGDGIPEIILHWDVTMLSRWGTGHVLFVYADGAYEEVAELWLHRFYRCADGHVYLYQGDFGIYTGDFGSISRVTFDADGRMRLELALEKTSCPAGVTVSADGRSLFIPSDEYSEMLFGDALWDYLYGEGFPVFALLPGEPGKPLFPIGPLGPQSVMGWP